MNGTHRTGAFDCGNPALDTFLKRFPSQNQRNDSARTFVVSRGGAVVGYYSLCAASSVYETTPEKIRKGLARHSVPLVLLARLAVDRSAQGEGLGSSLLLDAFARFLSVQGSIAAKALLAHAKEDAAKAFYERWGFQSTDDLPYHLFISAPDIRASLALAH